jgi:hypothetical protein
VTHTTLSEVNTWQNIIIISSPRSTETCRHYKIEPFHPLWGIPKIHFAVVWYLKHVLEILSLVILPIHLNSINITVIQPIKNSHTQVNITVNVKPILCSQPFPCSKTRINTLWHTKSCIISKLYIHSCTTIFTLFFLLHYFTFTVLFIYIQITILHNTIYTSSGY